MRQRGFSVMEVLGLMGFLGVISFAVISLSDITKRRSHGSKVSFSAEMLRKKIEALLQNEHSWNSMVQANENLACLRPPVNCAGTGSGKGGTFVLHTAAGVAYYNPGPANSGFNLEGEPCDSFDAVNGDHKCPFRVTYTWKPECPASGACDFPKVRITGGIEFMPSKTKEYKNIPFKKEKYAFDFRRGGVQGIAEGESERLAKWVTDSEVGKSEIVELLEKIGVAVPSPQSKLAVAGNAKVGSYAGDGIASPEGLQVSGRLGIGSPAPKARVHVVGAVRVANQVDCTPDTVGTIRYDGEKFQGCFPGGNWCRITGCAPPAP